LVFDLKISKKKKEYDGIVVHGASEHNLKNVTVHIPRNKITVITGLSGSGKSSLAFDTIYAEGQRRYIESLSSYARQFLAPMKKPEVESINGLSPAIAIEQKTASFSPRSTVGTMTEVYDFLRLLYAKVGTPHCPIHNQPVESQTPQQIVQSVKKMKSKEKYLVLAPVAQGKKGEFLKEFERWAKKGFLRARVDGQWIELESAKKLSKRKAHDIDLLVDRLVNEEKFDPRLKESINTALSLASGQVTIEPVNQPAKTYSIHQSCPQCDFSFPEMEPRHFSFNNPRGACESCNGLGVVEDIEGYEENEDDEEAEWVLTTCEDCHGSRLNERARNVLIQDRNISDLGELSLEELHDYFENLDLKDQKSLIAEKILLQIKNRLEYLIYVGCGYLNLSRQGHTLSGGESQRIRLATQVGSSLIGVLYILDEPSIGLHPKDHNKLLDVFNKMKSRGNTILLVEHDEETIRRADHLIDIGPRAGVHGGQLIFEGDLKKLQSDPKSLTGQYISGKKKVVVPKKRRKPNGSSIKVIGARGNNLKNINVEFPLGVLCGVTGVSGSGKSTLVRETLYKSLSQSIYKSVSPPSEFDKIEGIENIDKVIEINQKPIGRTPRSIPATYVGLFPLIRGLFSQLPESQLRGYKPGHFSFNVKGGRCEQCKGMGRVKLEMHFLANVFVPCETCQGKRYNREVLNIRYKDKNIADILDMTVEEAVDFFASHKQIRAKLDTLKQVGLEYIALGQNSKTLSGGEAQRVKLSKELSKRATGRTMYILDEPTTGLHFEDINKLLELLHGLVDTGNTVVVIEHNLDVIRSCDYLIDIGPEGGVGGGEVVCVGTPEEIKSCQKSYTAQFI
jgi:excinuclease ABC subunit A